MGQINSVAERVVTWIAHVPKPDDRWIRHPGHLASLKWPAFMTPQAMRKVMLERKLKGEPQEIVWLRQESGGYVQYRRRIYGALQLYARMDDERSRPRPFPATMAAHELPTTRPTIPFDIMSVEPGMWRSDEFDEARVEFSEFQFQVDEMVSPRVEVRDPRSGECAAYIFSTTVYADESENESPGYWVRVPLPKGSCPGEPWKWDESKAEVPPGYSPRRP